jgi:molecular chaperone IbpA
MTKTLTLRSQNIPSFHKLGIGFNSMFDEFDRIHTQQASNNYPPYNIVQVNEDEYIVSLAVAGFGLADLKIVRDKNFLIIEGKEAIDQDVDTVYIHKGISNRDFRREFKLEDHVKIEDAKLVLGILSIYLKREIPEEQKPRTIPINVTD